MPCGQVPAPDANMRQSIVASLALYAAIVATFASGVRGQIAEGVTNQDSCRHSGQQRTAWRAGARVRASARRTPGRAAAGELHKPTGTR